MAKTLRQLAVSYGDWLALNGSSGADDSAALPRSVRNDLVNMSIRELLRRYDTEFGEHTETFQAMPEQLDYTPFAGFLRPTTLWWLNPTATIPTTNNPNSNIVTLDFLDKLKFDDTFPGAGLFGDPAPMGAGSYGQAGLADPQAYTIWEKKVQLGPVPIRQVTVWCNGFRLLPDLANDDDTNIVTDDLWEYVLFKGLALAEQFGIEDDRMAGWEARASAIAEDAAHTYQRRRAVAKRLSQSTEPG